MLQKSHTRIFIIYWFVLIYIIAALVWWFISLSHQNEQMAFYKTLHLKKDDINYSADILNIQEEKKRKTGQYIGEGITFLLLVLGGAIFIFRSVRKQLKQSLQQQNFMMAITHELKTPIAISKLNLETLQKRKLDEARQQKLLNNTLQEANRMDALCNNLLVSSQIDAGGYRIVKEKINLSSLVFDIVNDFKTRYPNKSIQNNIEDDIFITGDIMLIQIAINNLIENAIKYSPKEKPVFIELSKLNSTLHGRGVGGEVSLKVKDEGLGINNKDKKKVFEKFYRMGNEATKKAKGTGLGLYLAKKILKVHKGKIYIEDNQPQGSIFNVNLKVHE